MKPKPGDVILTFRPKDLGPREPAPAQRIRKLLKHASYLALKCIDVAGTLPPVDPELDVEKTEPPFHTDLQEK